MLWYEIEKILSQKYNIKIKLAKKEALFGYFDVVMDLKGAQSYFQNLILYLI